MGEAGAAWVRVANELANVSIDYDKIVERLTAAWESEASTAVVDKLAEFGEWLRALSLGAAANGQRAEEAAVANTVAVLAMPSVSEAMEAKAAQDMMASLAAYNGAILNGNFAEFDDAARADHADAAAVMRQYENAVSVLAQPWEQPLPHEVSKGQSLRAEQQAQSGGAGGGAGLAGGGVGVAAMPLAAWQANGVGTSAEPKTLQRTAFSGGGAGGAGMGGAPYAPMAGYGRGGHQDQDYESTQPAASLAGAGEPTSGLSDAEQSWLPAGSHNDSPFVVSAVSWGPDTAVFDELAMPASAEADGFADEQQHDDTLERVSDRWVAPAVIGHDRRAEL